MKTSGSSTVEILVSLIVITSAFMFFTTINTNIYSVSKNQKFWDFFAQTQELHQTTIEEKKFFNEFVTISESEYLEKKVSENPTNEKLINVEVSVFRGTKKIYSEKRIIEK